MSLTAMAVYQFPIHLLPTFKIPYISPIFLHVAIVISHALLQLLLWLASILVAPLFNKS
jgi:hypothetical protein